MKYDIDIFQEEENGPSDYRWDQDQNAKLLNIVFHSGTFGNFLKFFLDKFSQKTPNIVGDPFMSSGIAHKFEEVNSVFSGFITLLTSCL